LQREFEVYTGSNHAVALNTGTSALHLALLLAGVDRGDTVMGSDLTFAASANAAMYLDAVPMFVDSERASWNLDPDLVAEGLSRLARVGRLPAAVLVVHVFGQPANLGPIIRECEQYEIPVVEDAAESLGATFEGQPVGSLGHVGVYSLNGNKIITASAGGILVTNDRGVAARALKLAAQAREPVPHYEHREVGYNYRMSNILAAIGRGQLQVLEERVQARRRNFEFYFSHLADLPGLEFMPEVPWGRHTRWLTTLTIEPSEFGANREDVRLALEAENIESRTVWKPMHLQPVFRGCKCIGGSVAEDLFSRGLCLPSGSAMAEVDLERVVSTVRKACPSVAG
jgi:pyridoxal phosphate-dependent aminotransferase EpsN